MSNQQSAISNQQLAKRLRASRSGQTLIEAVAAIALTLIVTTSLVGLGVGVIRSATAERNRALATAYAQEGLEAARTIRDRGYSGLLTDCGSAFCLDWSESQWTCDCDSGTEDLGSGFSRSFEAVEVNATGSPDPGSGRLRVTSTVTWNDFTGGKTLDLTTYLTDWR